MEKTEAPPFEVHSYSKDALVRLLAELSPSNTTEVVRSKAHTAYLDGYLTHLGVRTIVVERQYVDRDYLEDFAAYYVKCFERYDRLCARLHFFAEDFDEPSFRTILLTTSKHARLQRSYCGFVVVKPLPRTILGRTCLRTYQSENGRSFPVARKFTAHLFGVTLDIQSTLPFQEQDTVVAACATSALWSVLQATAREFHHEIMTPIEITRAATYLLPASSRMIPNREGLSSPMMAEAIRSVGLEPLMFDAPPNDYETLKAALYSYLHARIPVIMGVCLVDVSGGKTRTIGDHAIAIAGYKISTGIKPRIKSGIRLRSSRIEKIYVHDDQVGPFARMDFDGQMVKLNSKFSALTLSSSISERGSKIGKIRAIPIGLLIPHYHKIRIHFEDVMEAVADFNGLLASIRLPKGFSASKFEWDIYLTTVIELKESIASSLLQENRRLDWLTRPMPRFIWRATLYSKDTPILDVVIDATDIQTSNGVHGVIVYDLAWDRLLTAMASSPNLKKIVNIPEGARRILSSLA